MSIETEWQPAETAPKDGSVIIGDFGKTEPRVAFWNESEQCWIYCFRLMDEADGVNDPYFEENFTVEIRAWVPMPKLNNEAQR